MKVTMYNDFHNTWAQVRIGDISVATVRRVKRKLCGISGCTCGDWLGRRGRQASDEMFEQMPDGSGRYLKGV